METMVDKAILSDISDEVKKILNIPFRTAEIFRNRPCNKDDLCVGTINVIVAHLTDIFCNLNELGYGVLDDEIDEDSLFETMSNTVYFEIITVLAYISNSQENLYTSKDSIYDTYNFISKNKDSIYLNKRYDTYMCMDMICTMAIYHSYEYIIERKYI